MPEALPHPEVAEQLVLLQEQEAAPLFLPSAQLSKLCCVVGKAQGHALSTESVDLIAICLHKRHNLRCTGLHDCLCTIHLMQQGSRVNANFHAEGI